MNYPESVSKLIESLSKLPGVGPKTAERLALHIATKMKEEDALNFAKSLLNVKRELMKCPICGNLTDKNPCSVCRDNTRDRSIIAVVEEVRDLIAMEKMKEYRGMYHVLNGAISPINGIGPQDINLPTLLERLKNEEVKEIIMATNTTIEGESTAMYIAKLLEKTGIKVTRIARGLPVGGGLEYADEVTLLKAIEGRREFK
ncbi:MAG: recombination protein RecR [Haloplasmataceae bacterium]|jgi:recombination protein RecR|nr:recombination protein RecR [Haloplasmataceae bacterium]